MRVETGPGWELRCGDCLDPVTGLASLADGSVQHCITDPPYSKHTHEKQWIGAALTEQGAKRVKTAHAGLGFEHISEDKVRAVAEHCARAVVRWSLYFTDVEGIHLWRVEVSAAGLDYVRTIATLRLGEESVLYADPQDILDMEACLARMEAERDHWKRRAEEMADAWMRSQR